MNKRLIELLTPLTEEEKKLLNGENKVDKNLYTDKQRFTVDSKKFLGGNKLIDIRTHTRFVDFPRHTHNYIEMIYMCKGSTEHILNGTTKITLREGELLLLNQHTVHEVKRAGENDLAINFIIKPEFFTATLDMVGTDNVIYNFIISTLVTKSGNNSFMHFNVSGILPIQNLIENMIWSLLENEENGELVNKITMGLLFIQLLNYTDKLEQNNPLQYEQYVSVQSLKYIETDYKEGMLTDLAGKLHISVVNLSKIIKKTTESNFKSLQQNKRLQQAEKLIRETNLPITDIIYSVGYENTNFFYKLFENRYKMSPKIYRVENGNGKN